MEVQALHPLDWTLFVLLLVVSLGIGLYHAFTGGRQRTTKEFLLADRQLKVIPTAMSMFVSTISAIYIIGQTAEFYLYGAQMFIGVAGSVISHILSSLIFVPLFYKLKLTSGYQYLNRRYESDRLRLICVILSIALNGLHNGLALYAPSTAIEAVTGFPWWASLIITGLVSTIYTMLGGMRAVIWTDVFQACIMFAGLIAVMVLGTIRVGGMQAVFEVAGNGGRLVFFDFNPDPTVRVTFWSAVSGRLFLGMAGLAAGQANIQRYCALPTLTKARLSLIANIPFVVFMATTVFYLGLVMYAYFTYIGCDPLRSGAISRSNQLLPYFVVRVLNYNGLTGLFLSVMFAAALSTSSSSLTSQSALCWKDIIEPRIGKIAEHKKAMVTKLLVLAFGVMAIGIGVLGHVLPGHIMEVSQRAIGALAGPLIGVFMLAAFFPCANAVGAMAGILCSLVLVIWINVGWYITRPHRAVLQTTVTNCSIPANSTVLPVPTDPPPWTIFPLYRVSFLWIASLSAVTCIIVGLVASCALGGTRRWSVDARLLIPISNFCCFFLPKSVRRFLWCGVDHDKRPSGEINLDEEQEENASAPESVNEQGDGVVAAQPVPETAGKPTHGGIKRQHVYENEGFVQFSTETTKL